jgi:hypothetical protein
MKGQHLPRADHRLDAGLRIAPDALTLFAVAKRTEAPQFDGFST